MRFAFVGNEAVGRYVDACLTRAGFERAQDIDSTQVVFTYVTYASGLEDAYFEDNGLVKLADEGTLLVDLSPSSPAFAREVSAIATVNNLRFVEAPLYMLDASVTDFYSATDVFGCYVAGEEADVEDVRPLLDAIASVVEYVGDIGCAQLAKATHTVQATAAFASAIEAEALCRVVGEATNSVDGPLGFVRPLSDMADDALKAVVEQRFDGDFTVEMLMGDVAAAMTTADDVDLILPQLESVMHLLELLAVIGGADKAPAALSLLYRSEEESTSHGLDWHRAEEFYAESDHDHGDDDYDDYDDFDDDYDDYDDRGMNGRGGYAGGFGGYSAN